MKAFLAFAFAAAFAAESFGVDAVWTNTATSAQSWLTLANWTNKTGEAVSAVPRTAADAAFFPDLNTAVRSQTVRTVNMFDASANSFELGALTGARFWNLAFTDKSDTWGSAERTLMLPSIMGFDGRFTASAGRSTIAITGTGSDNRLADLKPTSRLSVSLAEKNAAVTVENITGQGVIGKKGAGKLIVGTVQDAGVQIFADDGTVSLEGTIADDDPLLAKAWAHLDASARETWEPHAFVGDDGRTYVTNWLHATGGDIFCRSFDNSADKNDNHVKKTIPPYVSSVKSPTGLDMISFGSVSPKNVALYGPTNCIMAFSSRTTAAREVFWVTRYDDPGACNIPPLGDSNGYDFAGNQVYLFKSSASAAVKQGIIFKNGMRDPGLVKDGSNYDSIQWPGNKQPKAGELQLVSVGSTGGVPVAYLATDRLYYWAVGGHTFGEVLIYTNELTMTERRLINRYLKRKWFADVPSEATVMRTADDTVALEVPSGRTARVETLIAGGSSVKKTGEGTLIVGRLSPADATVTLEGGKVLFDPVIRTIPSEAPATGAQFQYDASAEDSLVTNEQGVVTAWKDARAEFAEDRQVTCSGSPTVDTTVLPGRRIVDFPVDSYGSMPGRINGNYAFQYSVFEVFRFTTETAAKSYNVLGAGDIKLTSDSYLFLRPDRAPWAVSGGIYSIDGVPVDPFAARNGAFEVGKWYVASAVMPSSAIYNKIAFCSGSSGSNGGKGGMQVAEVITYGRALSADERRATEAYLMQKWLGKPHPDTLDENLPSFAYPKDAPACLDVEADITVESVSGGDGTLVKRGSGTATVVADLDETMSTLSVEEGELVVSTRTAPEDRSAFHFDATKTDSFTSYFVVTEESGAVKTNVQTWADVRNNGITARAHIVDTPARTQTSDAVAVTNPVITHVETAVGKTMPLVDFGHMSVRAGGVVVMYDDSAALRLYKDDSVNQFGNIVESHVVWCPAHETQGSFFGADYPYNDYYRGNSWIFSNTACGPVKNGRIEVNGVAKVYNNAVTPDVHLLSTVPTDATHVGFMCFQANNGGGCLIGEVLGFTQTMTEKERTYVKTALMNKWFDTPAPVWTNDLSSLSVKTGTTLTVGGGAIAVSSVAGGGTIVATSVSGIAMLNLATTDRTTVEGLTIEGVADFAGAVAVTLTGTDAAKLKPGKYALVTATSFANLDLAQWTLSSAQMKNGYRFVREGNTVFLEVLPNGLLFIVR